MKVIVFVLFALTLTTSASAGPVLLTSFDLRGGDPDAPQDEARVQFALELEAVDSPSLRFQLGTGDFWSQGDTGTEEYTAATDPDFLLFETLATNGINDEYSIIVTWPGGRGGAPGGYESQLFDRDLQAGDPPDLVGYELDLVRLIVHDVEFEPWQHDTDHGYLVHYDLTYEFYGHVIPEPATAVLVLAALPAIIKRAGGKCDFRIWRSKP